MGSSVALSYICFLSQDWNYSDSNLWPAGNISFYCSVHSPNLPYSKRVGSPAAALLISWSSTEVWPGKAQPAYGRNQVVVGIAQ